MATQPYTLTATWQAVADPGAATVRGVTSPIEWILSGEVTPTIEYGHREPAGHEASIQVPTGEKLFLRGKGMAIVTADVAPS